MSPAAVWYRSGMSILAFAPGAGRECIHPGGAKGYNVLTAALTKGSHAVVIADAVVGAAPPYHKHAADETFLVLEGTFEFVSEGVALVVPPGGVAYIPGGTPHTARCTAAGPRGVGKTIVILAPGGLEGFFDDVERLRLAGRHPTPAQLADLARPYGIDFLGDEPPVRERRMV